VGLYVYIIVYDYRERYLHITEQLPNISLKTFYYLHAGYVGVVRNFVSSKTTQEKYIYVSDI